jgi:hypothetical protein
MHQEGSLPDPPRPGNGDALSSTEQIEKVGDFPPAAEEKPRVGNRTPVIEGITLRHILIVAWAAHHPHVLKRRLPQCGFRIPGSVVLESEPMLKWDSIVNYKYSPWEDVCIAYYGMP